MALLAIVLHGMAWFGLVYSGLVGSGTYGVALFSAVPCRTARHDVDGIWHAMALHDRVRKNTVQHSKV